jgi:hypothetical protein
MLIKYARAEVVVWWGDRSPRAVPLFIAANDGGVVVGYR